MVWIKGARCGISNCASHFYQVLAGQRVCQNGHVQEGLETTGDEDDYNAIGQKIRQPRSQSQLASQRQKEPALLRGKEAKIVTFELLQVILKHQVKFVKHAKNLSSDFEDTVRGLWSIFLETSKKNNAISLAHLVALIYLATRIVNYPVLLIDFHLWIRSSELPYLECWQLLDPQKLEMMPPEQRKQFRPSSEPGWFYLHRITQDVKNDILAAIAADNSDKYSNIKFHDVDDRYVCFRVCRDLLLPPHIYVGAMRLLKLIDKNKCARKGSVSVFEEVPATCMVLIAVKLYYGLDGIQRATENNENQINWDVWRDIVRKTWLMQPEYPRADERLVHLWSEEQMDQYLAWFRQTIVPARAHTLDRRLETMFPLPDTELQPTPHADDETIKQLSALVQSTEDPFLAKLANGLATDEMAGPSTNESPTDAATDKTDTGTTTDEMTINETTINETIKVHEPGAYYPVFSVRTDSSEELPEMIGVLYNITARFLGTDEQRIRQAVRVFERWLKRQHKQFTANSNSA